MSQRDFEPIHPGEILLEEFLKPMGITRYRLAKDINVPQRRISEIVQGKRSIYRGYGPTARSLLWNGSAVLVEPPSTL
jgi:hypothetical protein